MSINLPKCEVCGGAVYRRLSDDVGRRSATGPLWHLDQTMLYIGDGTYHEPVLTDAPTSIPLFDWSVTREISETT